MVLGGLIVLAYGVVKVYTEPAGIYSNYWGGQVFAPVVVLAGAIMLIGGLLRRKSAGMKDDRQPEEKVEFPHESIDRPWNG